MKVHEYREMMRYLTRPERSKDSTPVASNENLGTQPDAYEDKKPNMNDPGMIINPSKILPKNFTDDMPFVTDENNPEQLELKKGGRVELKGGSPLTDTGKDLEDSIKEDHKAFNDYRKSIGQGPIPLDNKYIQMWIRSRLNSGGPANKQLQKIIPLDLESVAFKLFQDKLDNLSYNQKQTVYDYIEDNRNKKAIGGRVNLANGTEEPYNPEIPSLEETDPRGILQQQIINEKDPIKIEALNFLLEQYDKKQLQKQKVREEEKAAQKEKGIKYKEDFPSDAAYFAETGKQLLTNPKYTLGKIAKGAIEGTEFLGGQFGRSFLGIGKTDPSKSPLENLFYTPVLGEKLKINKLIEEGTPKDPTTGTLLGGEALEIGAGFLGPYEAYLLSKAAKKGVKDLKTKPATEVDEKIDPARRDILKTGAVMTGGAVLYPAAKRMGMFDDLAKGVKVVRVLPKVKGMPEWFNPLITRIENEGLDVTSEISKLNKSMYAGATGREVAQAKRLEIPVPGKKEPDIITMTEYKNGDFIVESNTYGGAFDSPFDLSYTAPKEVIETQFLKGKDGKVYEKKVTVKKEGKFIVIEDRPYSSGRYEGDTSLELEPTELPLNEAISDIEKLEKVATGKNVDLKSSKQRQKERKFAEENPYDDMLNRQPDPPDPDYGI